MSILEAVVQKPTPDSKVGINFEVFGGKLYIKTVIRGGLAAATEMDVGMELISINQTSAVGKTPEAMRDVIGNAFSFVAFTVKKEVCILFKVDKNNSVINRHREVPPRMFMAAGIPTMKYTMIFDKLTEELFPNCALADAKDIVLKGTFFDANNLFHAQKAFHTISFSSSCLYDFIFLIVLFFALSLKTKNK
jgi:hypothetical protein